MIPKFLAGLGMIVLLALVTTTSAHAQMSSGSFTAAGGESCNWNGFGNSVSMDCSGYSRSAGGYTNYHCDLDFFGSSMSYRCRSIDGMTWSGSR